MTYSQRKINALLWYYLLGLVVFYPIINLLKIPTLLMQVEIHTTGGNFRVFKSQHRSDIAVAYQNFPKGFNAMVYMHPARHLTILEIHRYRDAIRILVARRCVVPSLYPSVLSYYILNQPVSWRFQRYLFLSHASTDQAMKLMMNVCKSMVIFAGRVAAFPPLSWPFGRSIEERHFVFWYF